MIEEFDRDGDGASEFVCVRVLISLVALWVCRCGRSSRPPMYSQQLVGCAQNNDGLLVRIVS